MKLGLYKHYKGKLYNVINVAKHTETEELLVVYQALYGNYEYWVRPFDMFHESVEINSIIQPRFTYIGNEELL